MKRLIIIMGILCLFAGCSATSAPERTVKSFLDKLAGGNVSGAADLTVDGTLNLDKKAAALYKPLFQSIRYAIGGSAVEGDTATVSVMVTILDLEALTAEAAAEMMRHILSGGRNGDDYFYELLLEMLEDPAAVTVSLSATAGLVREGGKWRINLGASGGFSDAITGEMGQIIGY